MAEIMPLDDVRVLDLTRHAAGPFATRLLADYGADVIKIEPPEGDPSRHLPPFLGDEPGPDRSGMFLFLNTNKRSVVLDLKTDEGRERFLQLAADADVVVENFMPGTLERLGIGYETLREVNPRLVLTSISNFGQDGPYRDWVGTDLTLYAMGGPMLVSGEASYEPVKTAGRMTSYHTGLVGALATSVAIRGAELRGEGEHVDVNLYETALHSIDIRLARLMMYQYSGTYTSRPTLAAGVGSGVYPCADGFFLMSNGPQRIRHRAAHDGLRVADRDAGVVDRRGVLARRPHRRVQRAGVPVAAVTHAHRDPQGVRGPRRHGRAHQHRRRHVRGRELQATASSSRPSTTPRPGRWSTPATTSGCTARRVRCRRAIAHHSSASTPTEVLAESSARARARPRPPTTGSRRGLAPRGTSR